MLSSPHGDDSDKNSTKLITTVAQWLITRFCDYVGTYSDYIMETLKNARQNRRIYDPDILSIILK